MIKNSNFFTKIKIYDHSIVGVIITYIFLLTFLPEKERQLAPLCIFPLYVLAHIGCGIHNSIPFLRKRLESVEKIYEGSFDQLVKDMYSAGLELKTQIGDRYIFNTAYLASENNKYLVQDQGNICTVRSTRQDIKILERCIDLQKRVA